MYVSQLELMCGVSSALDLISTAVTGHHKRVAYLACSAGRLMGLSVHDRTRLFMAGLLHDVGGLTLQSRLDALQFEVDNVEHAETGYRLLKTFPYLDPIAEIVRYHHTPWKKKDAFDTDAQTMFLSNLLNAADRADVLMKDADITMACTQVQRIEQHKGTIFEATIAEAITQTAQDNFCDVLEFIRQKDISLERFGELEDPHLHLEDLRGFSRFISHIIDFRSRFTATHSRGVAAVAQELAGRFDFSHHDIKLMGVAGNLHDLGKLGIPTYILDKPGKLTREEYDIIRLHPRFCDEVLSRVRGMEVINEWGSSHHERMDGTGYHKGRNGKELSLGARIMAVADVFTAVTENRPYRRGMLKANALSVLRGMSKARKLDAEVVFCLENAYDDIDSVRAATQQTALDAFKDFFRADKS
ncbi:MAG: HD-GYP domain-containing protein [Desulfovibrio sp.]|uniref:HD-GYP domain-containing protein n=1 Tax=Desulfovibrio sp. 7SRBS1 TaxID=3378064 RepID=UPI003B3F250E